MRAQTVLVTGVRGFTGPYVRRELESTGYDVVGTVMSAPAGSRELELDLSSLAQCRAVIDHVRPDYVLHLAGISYVRHADPAAFYTINVIGTDNLLRACGELAQPLKKIVVASSANVYGNTSGGALSETALLAPVNHYGISKMAMEYLAQTWFERLPVLIARPFNYTGRGQPEHFLIPKIVRHFREGLPRIELGNLDVSRDFSDVRTVARLYRELLESGARSEIINICSEQPYSLNDILDIMRAISGRKIEVDVNPEFVRDNEVKVLVGDASRLHSLLQDYDSIPLRDTLAWMYSE